mgnify:CR=1 FL=1
MALQKFIFAAFISTVLLIYAKREILNFGIWSRKKMKYSFLLLLARLEEPARKTESDVEILRVYGIREFIRKNKKRIPFVAGFILFAVLIYIQSLFIWEISVSGESDYTSDEILQHINEYYVQTGTPKIATSLRRTSEKILKISHGYHVRLQEQSCL